VLPLVSIAHFPGWPGAQAVFHSTSGQPLVAAADGGAGAPDKLWPTCLRSKPCLISAEPLQTTSRSMLLRIVVQRQTTITRPPIPLGTFQPPLNPWDPWAHHHATGNIRPDDVPTRPTYESEGACGRQIGTIAVRGRCHRIVKLGAASCSAIDRMQSQQQRHTLQGPRLCSRRQGRRRSAVSISTVVQRSLRAAP
jgi:hypothetical protein